MLDNLIDNVLDTVKRVGPPELPTLFGSDRSGKFHVAVLADDPVASAKETIRHLHITEFVIMATLRAQTSGHWYVAAHAEDDHEQINRLYRVPGFLDAGATQFSVFNNLLTHAGHSHK